MYPFSTQVSAPRSMETRKCAARPTSQAILNEMMKTMPNAMVKAMPKAMLKDMLKVALAAML